MAGGNLVASIILRLQDDASRGLDTARQRINGVGQEIDRVKQLAIGFLGFEAIKSGIETIVSLSDKFAGLTARVKLSTASEQEFNAAQGELFDIAQRSKTALEAVVGLYNKVQIGVKALGGSQKDAFATTEAVTQAFRISGASASESAGGIEQFTQAIASGVFRGDEFNSVMENGPRLAQALADGLGVPISALRAMATQGELTSDKVLAALLSQKDKLAEEYATLPLTVAGAWTQLENQFLKYIGQSKDAASATHTIADGIGFVTAHLDGFIATAITGGEVLLAAFGASKLKGLVLYTESMLAARAATMAATEAAETEAAAASAEAMAIATATAAREADIVATQEVIVLARGEALAKLAATNASIAQTRATIAALNVTVQTTSSTWLLTQATTSVTAAEAARAVILTDLAALSVSNARMNSELAAAQEAQAAATLAQGEAAAAATVPVTLFAKAIKAISWGVPPIVAAEVGVAIGEWATRFEWVQVAAANAGHTIAKIVAFGEVLAHPSFENWDKYGEELTKINVSFEETRAAIGKVDAAPLPTIFDRLKTSAESMADGIDAVLSKADSAATTHADAMVKPYADAAKAISAAFDAQTAQVDANLKQQLYAIDYLASSEQQKIAETTQAMIAAEFKKTTAALNAKIELDKTWSDTYGKAIELARKAGGDVSALEQKGAEARISSLQSMVNAYQSSVDNMIGEEHRLLDAVRKTAEERENLSRSIEDKIRALLQKGMGDVLAYADKQKQYDEKQEEAIQAILEGNFTDAKKFADDAIRLAESTAHAVDSISTDAEGNTSRTEVISQNKAIATSIAQIKESAALADSALSGLGNSQVSQAKSIATALAGAKSGLTEFKDELDKAVADVNAKAQLKITLDAKSAQDEIDKLAALTAAKELSVKIKADPINADKEIADLQATLEAAKITVPAVVAFDKLRDGELEKMQDELNKSLAFLATVPVDVNTEKAIATFTDMKTLIDAKLSQPTSAEHYVTPKFEDVFKAIEQIIQNTSSTHTVYVNTVQNNATGGLIQHLSSGGRVAAQTFRRVVGTISGPGTGTSDEVPVMASNGEFMVKTDAVKYYGVDFMNALNNKRLPVAPGYAIGGQIGALGFPATAPSAGSPTPQGEVLGTLVFNFPSRSIPGQFTPGNAAALAQELRSLARAG